jgi:AcrR family transcriptional regulator
MPRQPSDARKRIVRAALELFSGRGYYGTSIADILKESGCTRGVLYHYFSSKEELGYAAMDEELRDLFEEGAVSYLQSDEHPIDRLSRTIDTLPTIVAPGGTGASISSVSLRMASVHDGFRKRLEERIAPSDEQIEEIVSRAVADGKIAGSVDPGVLAHVFITMGAGIHVAPLFHGREAIWEDARRWLKEYLNSLRA